MAATDSELWVVRHGETEWSRDGRHTSTTDLDLTEEGAEIARGLAGRLEDAVGTEGFDLVLSSPRLRAVRTAGLAGFADVETTEDLAEWDYGDYEGLTTPHIRETVPDWTVWSHPCPGGEDAAGVATRLDRVVERVREHGGRAIVFSHGHASRVLAARWLGLEAVDGRHFVLGTATLSTLGWERESPAVARWNA
ncbi:histidine phosphatase family protein [Nocardioides aurantiacus]|uniref:Putative phosphoglycerate mutase n=1 Tax=Nocardioides aurantiacus TaxID=86796 RepID=A0A3N2CY02_9ACTN|nr:histidine phosphatase family protein [Nocardioides aurantiacus]ROR92399.1 putative phosphoglycerate mutase [Nocardioides aurantiacus]